MASYLIIAKNKSAQEKELKKLKDKYSIDILDQTFVDKDSDRKTLGIQDILKMQERLFLKPFKSKNKGIFINNAHTLAIDAQNALLKVLEEPPANTIIVLLAESRESLLPTILSRCLIIEAPHEVVQVMSGDELQKFRMITLGLSSMSPGERLKLAETVGKSREDALVWLEQAIISLRNELISNTKAKKTIDPTILKHMQETYRLIKTTNVNVRLALEHLFLAT